MSVQSLLFPKLLKAIKFSTESFCGFLICSKCGICVYRFDNNFHSYIGEVIPYTSYGGKPMCISCYRKEVGIDE